MRSPAIKPPVPKGENQNINHPKHSRGSKHLDYLFVAFTTSTAFSPTDTPVLSRWAKLLTMLQAIISLGIVVLIAGRAINII